MKPTRCECGKVKYKKLREAQSAATHYEKKYKKKHRPYQCPKCPFLCLTTTPPKSYPNITLENISE